MRLIFRFLGEEKPTTTVGRGLPVIPGEDCVCLYICTCMCEYCVCVCVCACTISLIRCVSMCVHMETLPKVI